jgi:hypothetical protein
MIREPSWLPVLFPSLERLRRIHAEALRAQKNEQMVNAEAKFRRKQ